MIKIVSLMYRNPALSQQEFEDYWRTVHVPVIKEAIPELVMYKGSFPLADPGPERPGGEFACDGIVELGFPDMATLERAMKSPAWSSPERDKSSRHLLDLERTTSMIVEEIDIPLG